MHIPDGLMAPAVTAFGWLVAIVGIAVTIKLLNNRMDDKQIPLMAVLAAGIFVAQMLNFPIGGGTTGHLVGATLAAIILGPLASIVVMTVILVIQCLLFGDGGLTALGLNTFNMAILGSLTGWYVYKAFPEKYTKIGIFIASWLAVFLGSLACAIELSVSYSITQGVYGIPAEISVPAMLTYHSLIGVGEGVITTGIIAYLAIVSPKILRMPKVTVRGVSA